MQLCKFLKVTGVAVILALTYIHIQMQIVDLAYQSNRKEQQIKRLMENNGNTTYKILMLKSANHLGVAMLDNGSDMQFADADDVVEILTASDDFADNQPELAKGANPLLSLLSFGVEAEAKTAE